MNTAELNKLKKGELVELATQLQRERSNFSDLITTLRNNEAGLQELAANLQTEKAELEERFALLNSERDLLERKYRKAKRLLREKEVATVEPLRIEKPGGQVDRDYNLHDAMTGGGQLEIEADTYRKLLEFVRQAVDMSGMDKMALWKEQDPGRIGDVLVAAREGYPFLKHHVNTWPVIDIIHRYLTNSRKYEKKKRKQAEQGMGGADPDNDGGAVGPVPPNPMGGVDDDDDDVELSD